MSDLDEVKALLLELADCARRTEQKLDFLVDALVAEEETDQPEHLTLDGQPAGGERDPNEPL